MSNQEKKIVDRVFATLEEQVACKKRRYDAGLHLFWHARDSDYWVSDPFDHIGAPQIDKIRVVTMELEQDYQMLVEAYKLMLQEDKVLGYSDTDYRFIVLIETLPKKDSPEFDSHYFRDEDHRMHLTNPQEFVRCVINIAIQHRDCLMRTRFRRVKKLLFGFGPMIIQPGSWRDLLICAVAENLMCGISTTMAE